MNNSKPVWTPIVSMLHSRAVILAAGFMTGYVITKLVPALNFLSDNLRELGMYLYGAIVLKWGAEDFALKLGGTKQFKNMEEVVRALAEEVFKGFFPKEEAQTDGSENLAQSKKVEVTIETTKTETPAETEIPEEEAKG